MWLNKDNEERWLDKTDGSNSRVKVTEADTLKVHKIQGWKLWKSELSAT